MGDDPPFLNPTFSSAVDAPQPVLLFRSSIEAVCRDVNKTSRGGHFPDLGHNAGPAKSGAATALPRLV